MSKTTALVEIQAIRLAQLLEAEAERDALREAALPLIRRTTADLPTDVGPMLVRLAAAVRKSKTLLRKAETE